MEYLNIQLEPYRCQLQRVFIYYCSFGDKQNFALLKIQNYQRLLTDMQLIKDISLPAQYDVIFYAHTNQSTALNFKAFTEALMQISLFAFEGCARQQSIIRLITFHIQPLYDHILSQTDFGKIISLISAQFLRQQCFIFLSRFEQGLKTIYNSYFVKEGKSGFQQEFKIFTKLARELNICPKIVPKPLSFILFLFLNGSVSKIAFHKSFSSLVNKAKNQYKFDFLSFINFIIIVSHIKNRGEQKDQIKIYQLLENIQISAGCQQLAKKIKFQHFFLTEEELREATKDKIETTKSSPSKANVRENKYVESVLMRWNAWNDKMGSFK